MRISDLDMYQEKALRTLNDKGRDQNILHCVMGMSGEIAEYLEAVGEKDCIAELGDCMWYSAVLLHILGHSMKDIHGRTNGVTKGKSPRYASAKSAVLLAGENTDSLKKTIFYGKPLNEIAMAERVGEYVFCIESLAKQIGVNLLDVATRNIEKLTIRFPEKYEDHLAINRDEVKEGQ